jgi:hypothetical protein
LKEKSAMVVQIAATNTLAQRLQTLAQIYRQGQASELMDRALDKLLAYETETSRAQLSQLQSDLDEFELRYKMSSLDFYHRYKMGQTDDRMDFVEWASLVQMAENLKLRIRTLSGKDQP